MVQRIARNRKIHAIEVADTNSKCQQYGNAPTSPWHCPARAQVVVSQIISGGSALISLGGSSLPVFQHRDKVPHLTALFFKFCVLGSSQFLASIHFPLRF